MSGKVRTKQDKTGEIIAYSEGAVRNNGAVVEYCRISMAALSGGMAGLLGLTGLYGFGFYIFAVIGLWAMLLVKAGGQWKKFFISRYSLLTNGFFGGLFVISMLQADVRFVLDIPIRYGSRILRKDAFQTYLITLFGQQSFVSATHQYVLDKLVDPVSFYTAMCIVVTFIGI